MTHRERIVAVDGWAKKNPGLASILTPVVTSLLTIFIIFMFRSFWPGVQVAELRAQTVVHDSTFTHRIDSTNAALAAHIAVGDKVREAIEANAEMTLGAVCVLMNAEQKDRVPHLPGTCRQILDKPLVP